MRAYITPAGKTALAVENFLDRPREEFQFDIVIMLSNIGYVTPLYEKFHDENVVIVPISNPYFGQLDYIPAVRRLVRQTLLFVKSPELIVINSSGGTEKMTNIVKDAGDILELEYPVIRVFGVFDKNTRDVIFTQKPNLDKVGEFLAAQKEVDSILELKEKVNETVSMDVDPE